MALAVIVLFTAVFASLNTGSRTVVNLGFTVIYQVSVVRLTLGAFLLGMVTMFLVGLRQDLRLRRELQRRGVVDARGAAGEPQPVEPQRPSWEAPVSETSPPRYE